MPSARNSVRHGVDQFRFRIFRGEKLPEFAGDESRRLRLADDDFQDVAPVELASFAQNRLDTIIVQTAAINIILIGLIERPAGHGAGGFGHVLFRVMTFAEGEQLHAFAGEILVGMLAAALGLIEPDQHGGIGGGGFQQIQPVARTLAAKGIDLPPHVVRIAAP